MATQTENFKFEKPAMSDSADIEVLNGNMDKLDQLLKTLDNKTEVDLGPQSIEVTAFTEQAEVSPGFPWRGALPISGVTAADVVTLAADDAASDLGILSLITESYDGGVYVYCRSKPTQVLHFYAATKRKHSAA